MIRLITALLLVLPLSAFGATFTIGSGVSTFNCQTEGVQGGDIINITGGTRGPLTIRECGLSGSGATSSNRILIRNDPTSSEPVVIRRTSASNGGFLVTMRNNRFITVDGTGGWVGMPAGAYCGAPAGRTGCGIQITTTASGDSPSVFYRIDGLNMNNQIHKGIMINGTPSYNSSGGSRLGIDYNDHSQPLDGPIRENMEFANNYIVGVYGEGMYLGPNVRDGTRPATGNLLIAHNLIEETGRDGAEAKSVSLGTATFIGNWCYNCGRRSDQAGQQQGLTVGGNAAFHQNFIYRSGEVGLRAVSWDPLPDSGPFSAVFENNVVVSSGQSGPNAGHGIAVTVQSKNAETTENFTNVVIRNNTIIGNLGRGVEISSNVAGPGVITGNLFADNAMSNRFSSLSASNNTTTTTAAAKFVNPSPPTLNFRLQSDSPAVDVLSGSAPTNFPAIDFDGISRPQGSSGDAGAFEFQSTPAPPPPPPPPGEGPPPPAVSNITFKPNCGNYTIDSEADYYPRNLWLMCEGEGSTVADEGGGTARALTISGADWEVDEIHGGMLSCVKANEDHLYNESWTSPSGTTVVGIVARAPLQTLSGDTWWGMSNRSVANTQLRLQPTANLGYAQVFGVLSGTSTNQQPPPSITDGNWRLIMVRYSDTQLDVSVDGSDWSNHPHSITGLQAAMDTISFCRRYTSSPSNYASVRITAAFVHEGDIADPSDLYNDGEIWSKLGVVPGAGQIPPQRPGRRYMSGLKR